MTLAVACAADGLGPGAGMIVVVLLGGLVVGAVALGGTMVAIGLALLGRPRPRGGSRDEER